MPTTIVKEHTTMKNGYTPEYPQPPEEICGTVDCSECPYFLRFDIC